MRARKDNIMLEGPTNNNEIYTRSIQNTNILFLLHGNKKEMYMLPPPLLVC